jgi:hypothetical protein
MKGVKEDGKGETEGDGEEKLRRSFSLRGGGR